MSSDIRTIEPDEQIAMQFHEVYERLAPSFKYETRAVQSMGVPMQWDAIRTTPNGLLMIAVIAELRARGICQLAPVGTWSVTPPGPSLEDRRDAVRWRTIAPHLEVRIRRGALELEFTETLQMWNEETDEAVPQLTPDALVDMATHPDQRIAVPEPGPEQDNAFGIDDGDDDECDDDAH